MNEPIANAIAGGTFHLEWQSYLVLLAIAFVGGALGSFLSTYWRERGKNYATSVDLDRITEQLRRTTAVTEETKAQVQKALWWSQESWKRKYDLYHDLILACEEIGDALWEAHGDIQTFQVQGGALFSQPSTDEDAKRLLPHHKPLLDIEDRGLERIRAAAIGAQLLLNDQANEALATLRSVRTQALYIANRSYRKRLETRMDGIVQCKEKLLAAAKVDLNVAAP